MWSKVGMGGEHHRYSKHNKFRQNPRGDPKFLVDLTRNDPLILLEVFQPEFRVPANSSFLHKHLFDHQIVSLVLVSYSTMVLYI